MKKRTLLFCTILASFIDAAVGAEELHVDRFKLNLRAEIIVGQLWHGENVKDTDIDEVFSAVSSSGENSGASSDEEISGAAPIPSPQSRKINSLISEFLEVTEDVAKSRSKTGKEISSLEDFAEKVRSRGQRNNPFVVELVLNNIAGKYC